MAHQENFTSTFVGPVEPANFKVSGAFQTTFSLRVPCSWCGSNIGERCKPSLVFPQYPHSIRMEEAQKQ